MENYKKKLKAYLKEDIIYQDYLANKNKHFADFDLFCIEHCTDIENLLIECENLNKKIEKVYSLLNDYEMQDNEILKEFCKEIRYFLGEK